MSPSPIEFTPLQTSSESANPRWCGATVGNEQPGTNRPWQSIHVKHVHVFELGSHQCYLCILSKLKACSACCKILTFNWFETWLMRYKLDFLLQRIHEILCGLRRDFAKHDLAISWFKQRYCKLWMILTPDTSNMLSGCLVVWLSASMFSLNCASFCFYWVWRRTCQIELKEQPDKINQQAIQSRVLFPLQPCSMHHEASKCYRY